MTNFDILSQIRSVQHGDLTFVYLRGLLSLSFLFLMLLRFVCPPKGGMPHANSFFEHKAVILSKKPAVVFLYASPTVLHMLCYLDFQ